MDRPDNAKIASDIADGIKKLPPLDRNLVAILTAQMLAEGKDRCALNDTINFLQLLITLLRSYC